LQQNKKKLIRLAELFFLALNKLRDKDSTVTRRGGGQEAEE
jgi:hypothetical protein